MPSQHTGTVQIRAARLADGISSSSKPNQAILITDGWITSVGDQDAIQQQTPPGTKIIDLGTACITPGLIDGHTHLSLAGDGRTYVEMFADSDEMMVLTGVMNLQRHARCWYYNHSRAWRTEQNWFYSQKRISSRLYCRTSSTC